MDIKAYIQSGIIESYVLGIASDEEIAEIEQFKSQYPEVQVAIDSFSDSLQIHAFENAVAPPLELKTQIMKTLSSEFRSTGNTSMNVVVNNTRQAKLTPPPGYKVWRFAAAASIILLLASSAINVYLFNKYSSASDRYQALLIESSTLQARNNVFQTMMTDTSIYMVKMPGVPGKKENLAVVFWNARSKSVYVMANKLPAPAAGKQYQLWALVDGKPVDAGMLDPNCDGVCQMKNVQRAQAFAITLEKKGGSPTPTMEQLFVIGKV